jgi:hypothetical protein
MNAKQILGIGIVGVGAYYLMKSTGVLDSFLSSITDSIGGSDIFNFFSSAPNPEAGPMSAFHVDIQAEIHCPQNQIPIYDYSVLPKRKVIGCQDVTVRDPVTGKTRPWLGTQEENLFTDLAQAFCWLPGSTCK